MNSVLDHIIPRRPDIDWRNQDIPKIWHPHGAFVSHYLNGQSLLFPAGERMFIEAVKYFQNRIFNTELTNDIRGFLGQESLHREQHLIYNQMIAKHGIKVDHLQNNFDHFIDRLKERVSPLSLLALTVCFEHFTALIAKVTIEDKAMLEGAHPAVAKLWKWHAADEVEHKSVAFDVYQSLGGGYFRRVFWMSASTAIFLGATAYFTLSFLQQDKLLFSPKSWLEGIYRCFISPGPHRRILPGFVKFFSPWFRP